jgi:hypothetical protein
MTPIPDGNNSPVTTVNVVGTAHRKVLLVLAAIGVIAGVAVVGTVLAPNTSVTNPEEATITTALRAQDHGSEIKPATNEDDATALTPVCASPAQMSTINAYIQALNDRDPVLAAAQFTTDGVVWSTSAGKKFPVSSFFGSFLPTLHSSHAELLQIFCGTDPKDPIFAASFRFRYVEEEGEPEEGGVYVDLFKFKEHLLKEVQMFENKFVV